MWIPAGTPHYLFSTSPKVDLYNFYFKKEEDEMAFLMKLIFIQLMISSEMILYTKDWDGKITKNDGSKYYFLKALKGFYLKKEIKNWHFLFSILSQR
jgi:hypothetical protein